MKTENYALLCSLTSNVAKTGPSVKYPCPIHLGASETLLTLVNGDTGDTTFECQDPACRFHGDAISLVAASRKITIQEAVALFRPGAELAGTLETPLTDQEAAAYTEGHATQRAMKAYLSQCQQSLRKTPQQAKLRAGLSRTNLNTLPAELGLLVRGQDIPLGFRPFNKTTKTNPLVYPFTFNDDVMSIRVQDGDSKTADADTVTVVRSDLGVFMERFPQGVPPALLMTLDPRDAAIMYGNYTAVTAVKPPIISASGFPLPSSLRACKFLVLAIDQKANPSLQRFLELYSAKEYIEGDDQKTTLVIRVLPRDSALDVTADLVNGMLERDPHNESDTWLETWILRAMSRLVLKGDLDTLVNAINAVSIPESKRKHLIQRSQMVEGGEKIASLLRSAAVSGFSRVTLGNGNTLQAGSTWIRGLSKAGETVALSNVGIRISHKVKTHTGGEVLSCVITPDSPGSRVLEVMLPEASWGSGAKIAKAIQRAYTEAGDTPYVALYDRPGYDWPDILAKLSERCLLTHEIDSLGSYKSEEVNFPNFVLNRKTGKIGPQNRIFTIPEQVRYLYSGVPMGSCAGARDPMISLLERCDNMYCAAFVLGVSQVLHNLYSPLYGAKRYRRIQPYHLMCVETEPGVWSRVSQALSSLFSGSPYTPTLRITGAIDTLKTYEAIGSLPLIARIPPLRAEQFRTIIRDSPINLIGIVDSGTAIAGGGYGSCTYLCPPSNGPERHDEVTPQEIEILQEKFAAITMEYLMSVEVTDQAHASASIPALAVYQHLCKTFKVKEYDLVGKLLKPYYGGYGMAGVQALLDTLHRVLGEFDDRPVSIVSGKMEPNSRDHIFIQDDVVKITHSTIAPLNDRYHTAFAIDGLTEELHHKGLLVLQTGPILKHRYWTITRKTWDTLVVRPSMWFQDSQALQPIQERSA